MRRFAKRASLKVAVFATATLLLSLAPSDLASEPAANQAVLPVTNPVNHVAMSADAYLDKMPPRKTKGLKLVRNGYTYDCMECHKLVVAKWHYDRPVNEHRDIHLEHGNNRFCLNCHHPTDRNAFVDYDGAAIAPGEVVQLCSKCHGTIYRDWRAGVHGRQNGFWKTGLGGKAKLSCIECHDPHSPKFKEMPPLPPLRYPPRGAHQVAGAAGNDRSKGHSP